MIRLNAAGGTWLDMLGLVLITVLVLAATWLATKWIGRRSQLSHNSRNVKIIERTPIAKDKYLAIIEVAGKFYLISVTAQNVQMMTEIEDPDKLKKQPQPVNQSFASMYKIIKEKGIRGLSDPESYRGGSDAGDETEDTSEDDDNRFEKGEH
jgi:flagellar protein FliO/FliZ